MWCDLHRLISAKHARFPPSGDALQNLRHRLLPDLPENMATAQLSTLAYTVHHMQRWVCNFIFAECVDVHNILKGQRAARDTSRRAAKRARCASQTDKNFSAAEHLPPELHNLMQPLRVASCQHPFPTLVMLLGAMGGMTNGAVVQRGSGGVSPVSAAVLNVGFPQ